MDARRNGVPLKKYAQDMAVKAGMPVDHYWHKIKPLVNEDQLSEADAHATLWPIIVRVLGRKLYTGKNSADIYSYHTPDGIEIHGAVTRGLKGNEALELEQALHAAGIPIEKVTIEPDMIRVSLRGEMDEATPAVLGMNENAADPYSPQTKYYIVRKDAGLNAIPGKSGSHTMAAARKQLAAMPDADRYEIRAINTTKIPKQEPQPELDEGLMDTLKVLALLGLGAYGINATLDSMAAPSKTPLGKALSVAAQHGDKSAAKYLANLDAYIEANDTGTLAMLKDSYLDGPRAAVKESHIVSTPTLRHQMATAYTIDPEKPVTLRKPNKFDPKTGLGGYVSPYAVADTESQKRNITYQLIKNLDATKAEPLRFEDDSSLEISPRTAMNALRTLEMMKAPQRHVAIKAMMKSADAFRTFMDNEAVSEAKYHGKTVKLGKPIRTNTGEGGKFKVYVKDPKTGNIKMVRFGDTTGLTIKRDDPKRRKSFRARHHCENPGPRTKANFWSCKMWTRKPVGKILKGK